MFPNQLQYGANPMLANANSGLGVRSTLTPLGGNPPPYIASTPQGPGLTTAASAEARQHAAGAERIYRRLMGQDHAAPRTRREDQSVDTAPICWKRHTTGVTMNGARYQWLEVPCDTASPTVEQAQAADPAPAVVPPAAGDKLCRRPVGMYRKTESPTDYPTELVPCDPPKREKRCWIL